MIAAVLSVVGFVFVVLPEVFAAVWFVFAILWFIGHMNRRSRKDIY
jgi:hypothetical protein